MADEKNIETSQEEINIVDDHGTPQALEVEYSKDLNTSEEIQMPSTKHEEEIMIKKKYGDLLKKKPPLISKDHEHAFFDSADWALGKAGKQKSKGPLEALLRPKLQPTPHQQIRTRSAYARADEEGEDNCESSNVNPMESHESTLDDKIEINNGSPDDQNHQKDLV